MVAVSPARGRGILWPALAAGVVVLASFAAAAQPTLTLTRVPGTDAVELVGDIPVTGPFAVRHRVPVETRAAILHVWPRAIQPDCSADPPPHDAPQTHVIEMDLRGEGEHRWANGTVPHLQVDREFCFGVQSIEGIALPPAAGFGLLEAGVATVSVDEPDIWARQLSARIIQAACTAATADGARISCDAERWQGELRRRLVTGLLGSMLPLARASRATSERAVAQAGKALGTLRERARRLPAAELPVPVDDVLRMNPAALRQTRDALVSAGGSTPWASWLSDYIAVVERIDFEIGRRSTQEQAVSEAESALVARLQDDVADFLTRDAYAERRSPAARGSARTGDADNFATPVYGVAVGVPLHGGDPWLFTYAGVHIFIEPVERSIPFDQMVGGTVAQRLSVFVGALTSDPGGVRNARVSPGLGGAYPGLGIGWRVTQHLAVDVIAFVYTATDDDPLNDRQTLGATVAGGLTAELDIVQWLTPD